MKMNRKSTLAQDQPFHSIMCKSGKVMFLFVMGKHVLFNSGHMNIKDMQRFDLFDLISASKE